MPEDHERRRDRLRAALADLDVEAALITRLVNVRYLSGFTGSNAALLVTHDGAVLATDGRYTEQSAREVPDLERVIDRRCAEVLLERATAVGAHAIAFEAHDVSVERFADLERAAGPARLTPLGHAVETLRQVKDDGEIALLREACAIGDRALADLLPTLHPGQSEREIARRLENLMLDHGSHGLSFETIVAGGPNSAVPHHQPTDRPVQAGELLKLDFGAQYGGYHADMTRTIVVGKHVEPWQEDLYVLVRAAQRAGRQALAPGVPLARRGPGGPLGDRGRRVRGGVLARAGPRGRPGDPRGADDRRLAAGYPWRWHAGHRRAWGVPDRAGRGPHRGHPRREGRHAGAAHHHHQGAARRRLTQPAARGRRMQETPQWRPRTT